MSKLRILFAIPCLALSMALVGCGGSESTFEPVESDTPPPAEESYMGGGDPYKDGGAPGAAAPAAPEGDKK